MENKEIDMVKNCYCDITEPVQVRILGTELCLKVFKIYFTSRAGDITPEAGYFHHFKSL